MSLKEHLDQQKLQGLVAEANLQETPEQVSLASCSISNLANAHFTAGKEGDQQRESSQKKTNGRAKPSLCCCEACCQAERDSTRETTS